MTVLFFWWVLFFDLELRPYLFKLCEEGLRHAEVFDKALAVVQSGLILKLNAIYEHLQIVDEFFDSIVKTAQLDIFD